MLSICLAYLIFTFREFKSIHKGKTAILHLRFGTEKNRRLGSKKARYNRAFRRRHLFCLHIMVEMRGVEPLSKYTFTRISPSAVDVFLNSPHGRLSDKPAFRLSRYSPVLPGIHTEFSCIMTPNILPCR